MELSEMITVDDLAHDLKDAGGWELANWLVERGFLSAPAAKDHHGNHEGGLIEHCIQVSHELNGLTRQLNLEWERPSSPTIIGLLHDVCKIDQYTPNDDGTYNFNKECGYPGHGEKSLIELMGHANLTEEEKMCIRYHMGAFTDSKEWPYYSRAVQQYPNVLYTHTADMIASQIRGI